MKFQPPPTYFHFWLINYISNAEYELKCVQLLFIVSAPSWNLILIGKDCYRNIKMRARKNNEFEW